MAIIKNGFTRGRIAHLTYSEHNGVQVVKERSKKETYKKTVATIDCSTVFGKASNLARYFRESLGDTYTNFHDSGMSSRLTGIVTDCIRPALDETNLNFNFQQESFKRLIGFEFNIKSPLENQYHVQPTVDYTLNNRVHIQLPEMKTLKDIIFPKEVWKCTIVLTCALFDLENGYYKDAESVSFNVEKTGEKVIFPVQYATFTTQPGCLCIIGISLKFYKESFLGAVYINNKLFNPCAILSTKIIPGIIIESVTQTWEQMQFKAGRQLTPSPPPTVQLLLGSPNYTAI
ncbi:MAG: hypothetical protein EOO89_20115 [Pedobacter sp.]|nr:MAG: hypothetical protein EOO89_20115 [Pedobacter sp.]